MPDDENPEWTAEDFKKAKRVKVGRPKAENPKQLISFRFHPSIVFHLKEEVEGYNRRVENLILEAMQQGRI